MASTNGVARRTGMPRRIPAALALAAVGLIIAWMAITVTPAAQAAESVSLGDAKTFGVLGASTVTNADGATVINGDLGLSPGTSITGFPPGIVNGATHSNDGVAAGAQDDAETAYGLLAGQAFDSMQPLLGGLVLTPGVYRADAAMALTGTVTLDAQNNPAAVFVFQAGSTLTTASSSVVQLTNEAQACNVFWQVGSSATLGGSTSFAGTIVASESITLVTGATVNGRVLALGAAVTLDTNAITVPACAVAATTTPAATTPAATTPAATDAVPTPTVAPTTTPADTPPPTPTDTPAPTATPTGTPGATATVSATPGPTDSIPATPTPTATPVIPTATPIDPTPTPTPATAPPPVPPTGTGIPGGGPGIPEAPAGPTPSRGASCCAVIPPGHPTTGAGGAAGSIDRVAVGFGAMSLAGAGMAMLQALRRRRPSLATGPARHRRDDNNPGGDG